MANRILVVDDEQEIREMLARHFRLLGYEVEMAANGQEAIDLFLDRRYDVVITDIMMPVKNGIQLLEYLREEQPMVRAIVISGYVTLDNALSSLRLGAEAFVFKPIEDLAELERFVEMIVEKQQTWQRKLRELKGLKPQK